MLTVAGRSHCIDDEDPDIEHDADDTLAHAAPMTPASLALHGRLTTLRPPQPDDIEFLATAAQQPLAELLVHSDLFRTYQGNPDEFHEGLMLDATQLVLAVYRQGVESSRPLGYVRLYSIEPRERYAFLEVMLVDRHAMRKGLGVEAGRLVCFYGLDVLGLERIEAKVYSYNRLSANALLRNGFVLEGTLRHVRFVNGAWHDLLVFGLLQEEARAARSLIPAEGAGSIHWPDGSRRLTCELTPVDLPIDS